MDKSKAKKISGNYSHSELQPASQPDPVLPAFNLMVTHDWLYAPTHQDNVQPVSVHGRAVWRQNGEREKTELKGQ